MPKQQTIPGIGAVPDDSSGVGAPDAEIKVSRAMRDAGEVAFDELASSYPPTLLVEAIYIAMRSLEPPAPTPQACPLCPTNDREALAEGLGPESL